MGQTNKRGDAEAAEKRKGEMGKKVEDGGWKMDGESEGATAFHPEGMKIIPCPAVLSRRSQAKAEAQRSPESFRGNAGLNDHHPFRMSGQIWHLTPDNYSGQYYGD